MLKAAVLERALAAGDFAALADAAPSLRPGFWTGLPPLLKLVLFKLLGAQAALSFYYQLPLPEKYFLLGGFPLGAIAPVLERASAADRRRFVSLPRGCYERMRRALLDESRAAQAART